MHRDLQPDNWMMKEDKTLTLVDFGCAKAFETRDEVVSKNDFMFPPSVFCSPEQRLGLPYSFNADVYVMGVCFTRMVSKTRHSCFEFDTSRKPIRGDYMPTMFEWVDLMVD